jgi:hypothetical protein
LINEWRIGKDADGRGQGQNLDIILAFAWVRKGKSWKLWDRICRTVIASANELGKVNSIVLYQRKYPYWILSSKMSITECTLKF